jgi:hypothetical protein
VTRRLIVPSTTPVGTYTLTYEICEAPSYTNCTTATITYTVTPLSTSYGGGGGGSSSSPIPTPTPPTEKKPVTPVVPAKPIVPVEPIVTSAPKASRVPKKLITAEILPLAERLARDSAMKIGFTLPEKLLDTGAKGVANRVIEKINANGVKIIKQKGIDTTPIIYGEPQKDIAKASRDVSYWTAGLPEQDKDASMYIVIPSVGTVTPIVNIPE